MPDATATVNVDTTDTSEGASMDDVMDVITDITDVPLPEGAADDQEDGTTNAQSPADSASQTPPSEQSKPPEASEEDDSASDEIDQQDLMDELAGVEQEEEVEEDPEAAEKEEKMLATLSEDAQNAFKEMREKLKTLQSEVKASNENVNDTEVVKQLRAEVEQLQGRLGAIDLTQSPEFKRTYTVPIQRELNAIGKVVKDLGENPQEIVRKAMSYNNAVERKRYLQNEVPTFASELSIMFTRVDQLVGQRREAMSNHQKTQQSLAAAEAQRRQDSVGKIFDDSVESVKGSNHFLYRASEKKGAEKWNADVEARLASAKDLIGRMSSNESEMVTAALKANVSDQLLAMYLQERAARISLEQETGKRKKSAPSVGGQGSSKKVKAGADKDALSGMEVADILASRDYGKGSIA